jgi:hypothetical protein
MPNGAWAERMVRRSPDEIVKSSETSPATVVVPVVVVGTPMVPVMVVPMSMGPIAAVVIKTVPMIVSIIVAVMVSNPHPSCLAHWQHIRFRCLQAAN